MLSLFDLHICDIFYVDNSFRYGVTLEIRKYGRIKPHSVILESNLFCPDQLETIYIILQLVIWRSAKQPLGKKPFLLRLVFG